MEDILQIKATPNPEFLDLRAQIAADHKDFFSGVPTTAKKALFRAFFCLRIARTKNTLPLWAGESNGHIGRWTKLPGYMAPVDWRKRV